MVGSSFVEWYNVYVQIHAARSFGQHEARLPELDRTKCSYHLLCGSGIARLGHT